MSDDEQESAFERELHALCTRFFDEWDIAPEAMMDILEAEKVFVLSILDSNSEEDDDDNESETWK